MYYKNKLSSCTRTWNVTGIPVASCVRDTSTTCKIQAPHTHPLKSANQDGQPAVHGGGDRVCEGVYVCMCVWYGLAQCLHADARGRARLIVSLSRCGFVIKYPGLTFSLDKHASKLGLSRRFQHDSPFMRTFSGSAERAPYASSSTHTFHTPSMNTLQA